MFDMKTAVELPDLDLLEDYDPTVSGGFSSDSLARMAGDLERNLAEFGVEAKVKSVLPGPVVTRFEMEPAPGLKVSKISSLVKDLARLAGRHQCAGGGGDPGQIVGRHRDSQRRT